MALDEETYAIIKRNSSIEVVNLQTGVIEIAHEKKVFEVLLAFEGISMQDFLAFKTNQENEMKEKTN